MKLKPEINSDLNEIRVHDLCDTGVVLYQLSYQAIIIVKQIHCGKLCRIIFEIQMPDIGRTEYGIFFS